MQEFLRGIEGVVRFEVGAEMKDGGVGGDGGETVGGHLGWELSAAGADEDVVGGVDAKEEFGVAEGAGGADVVSVLGEDGAGEGAEIGGGIEDEQAGASRCFRSSRVGAVVKGEDGFLFGCEARKDGHSCEIEEVGDEGGSGREVNASAVLCEVGRLADEEAEAHAVEPREAAEIEDESGEAALSVIDGGVERALVVAEDNAAGALNDVDAADVTRAERERHRASKKIAEGLAFAKRLHPPRGRV